MKNNEKLMIKVTEERMLYIQTRWDISQISSIL